MTNVALLPRQEQLVTSYLAPVLPWLRLDGVSEIMINGDRSIFVERDGRTWLAEHLAIETGIALPPPWRDESHLLACIEAIGNALKQPIHSSEAPILDARLSNGGRINAVLRPVACDGCLLNLRLFPSTAFTWDDLAARGTFEQVPAAPQRLSTAIAHSETILVSGPMRSGKTTLLNALIASIPRDRRIVIVEDTRECYVDHPNHVRCEAAARDHGKRIGLPELLKNAMRQSPDWIVCGEVRDGVAAGVALEAMSLGHPVLTTLHARDARGALKRLTKLALRADPAMPYAELRDEVVQAIDKVVHLQQMSDGQRRVVEILEVADVL